ncbi:type III restriction-modification system endonuclease [Aeromonas salmonicida]|uniref:DEAD/DEAH box helicase family protein n=1 Tax=Aeromonas salmonicida TaxID=645 RepID=A0AAX3W1J7_AERSA|nr:DEAD/DEAH box helicase family protein [Aeromonas salmonicida]WHF39156.1 DEAD/DEAH box helicase family protein [Aeromonas salmonicida]WHF39167.1 DEAD/DEAH box helicase family protein [Aeromonas salmonicida]
MKLHFEPDLDYQLDAITAVCDLFAGMERWQNEMTVLAPVQGALALEGATGASPVNPEIHDEAWLLANTQQVQLRNKLPPADELVSRDFTVEMETGTGKTYVYLRSMFELNQRFGMSKFIIVVPSVAIKEGVYKTLQITRQHFQSLYAGIPYDYYLYDSTRPGDVRNFATSSVMQIMVMTVGAINKKDVNKLYQSSEKTTVDELDKPIDLIRATRPVVIVDEPQSVDGGLNGAGKTALESMNSLITLRYSATHTDKHHMLYRLDAVDAYERKLVKQIEVAGMQVENAHNLAYVKLISMENKRGTIRATLLLDVERPQGGVQREEVIVTDGSRLDDDTGRAVYADYRIGEIRLGKGGFVTLMTPQGEQFLQPGDTVGDVEPLTLQRHLIRRTIREHLDKELRLNSQGIKVLSLFFIDRVDLYRQVNEDGRREPGAYARVFEDEYQALLRQPLYAALRESHPVQASEVHDGYFSIDKKGGWEDTSESNASGRDNAERGYNLIMKNKERLLSFSNPVRFLFSHSALKEGWDNPNVFQICSLREMGSERERRQTLGRGLRLCVNQDGERIRDDSINILTVVASEGYETYAEQLQQEIEQETGIKFGIVTSTAFAHLHMTMVNGAHEALGVAGSNALWETLQADDYLSRTGKVNDALKVALRDAQLTLAPEYESLRSEIEHILRKSAGRLRISNADERVVISPRQAVLTSEAFKQLWSRISQKTQYRLDFDEEMLIADCTASLRAMPLITRAQIQFSKGALSYTRAGLDMRSMPGATSSQVDDIAPVLPDILGVLQDKTGLTRRSLYQILTDSGRLRDFVKNPQQFLTEAIGRLNGCKQRAVVDGIKYYRLPGAVYAQTLFTDKELTGYTKNLFNAAAGKSVYEQVPLDSQGIEREFVQHLEQQDEVKLYAKLPGWFKIPTPLGSYNPDWALVIERDGVEQVYFVVETKGTRNLDELRLTEKAKITCGEAHFAALKAGYSDPAHYLEAMSVAQVMASVDDLMTGGAG